MEATATAPAPQHMRALAQANRVRLARAELKRQVAEGEVRGRIVLERARGRPRAWHRGPADEPASLGAYALPPVPGVDPDAGDQDDRLDDRAPAARAGRGSRRARRGAARWQGATLRRRRPARSAGGPPAPNPGRARLVMRPRAPGRGSAPVDPHHSPRPRRSPKPLLRARRRSHRRALRSTARGRGDGGERGDDGRVRAVAGEVLAERGVEPAERAERHPEHEQPASAVLVVFNAPRTSSTIPTSTDSSTSGTGCHGGFGRSSGGAGPGACGAAAPAPARWRRRRASAALAPVAAHGRLTGSRRRS